MKSPKRLPELTAHPEIHTPFAVNQIVHKSNSGLEEDMALTVKWKAPITSLGAREDVNAAVHVYGGLTLHDIINDRFAHKAIEKGKLSGLIAVAAGSGGHAGSISPTRADPGHPRMVRRALVAVGRDRHRVRASSRRKRWARTLPISARHAGGARA